MITTKEVSLTRDILEEIRRIDLEVYKNISGIDWYLSRYKPWHSAFVAMDDSRIIGYVTAVPVRKVLYEAVLNGVLVDDLGINPNMFIQESEYMYASSIVIAKEYRKQSISGRLVEMLADRFRGKKICLMSVTEEGRRLAGHYFRHWMRLTDDVDVFISKERIESERVNG